MRLNDFHNILFDVCNLMITLVMPSSPRRPPVGYLDTFEELLRLEGISFKSHSQMRNVYILRNASHMRRAMCKLPGRLANAAVYD